MNEDILKPESSNHIGRKRSRSENEDSEECLPIAKRINNLQIRSRECSSDGFMQDGVNGLQCAWDKDLLTSQLKENGFHPQMCNSSSSMNNNDTHFARDVNQPVPSTSGHCGEQVVNQRLQSNITVPGQLKHIIDDLKDDVEMEPYEPELDDSTNPHYYGMNKVLYYANFARQTRTRNGFKQ